MENPFPRPHGFELYLASFIAGAIAGLACMALFAALLPLTSAMWLTPLITGAGNMLTTWWRGR